MDMQLRAKEAGTVPGAGGSDFTKGLPIITETLWDCFKRKSGAAAAAGIAIIMDGNGRWARKQGAAPDCRPCRQGRSFRRIANYCRTLGVRYLTVYAFSTENWKRSQEEVSGIMTLLGRYLEEALRDMEKNRVHFVFFGDLSRLSPELQELCRNAEARSREYHEVQVNFCLNYGGRDEILRAARRFAQAVANGEQEPDQLDESLFFQYLYSARVPDPS